MSLDNSGVIGTRKIITGLNKEMSLQTVEKNQNKIKSKTIQFAIKRTVDILAGLVGVVLLIPITICIYIANRLAKDNGPIFYSHERIGKNGKHFKIYKYRSMVVGADEILKEYLANNEEMRKEFEENQKLQNDPRITKVGQFIRKTSIDELPQLINVLKGDMSLIGPRPIVDREIELFGKEMESVHSVKPGITGYWAANGRSNTSYEERVQMESYYANNFSIKLDAKILIKTIESVIKKEGAV